MFNKVTNSNYSAEKDSITWSISEFTDTPFSYIGNDGSRISRKGWAPFRGCKEGGRQIYILPNFFQMRSPSKFTNGCGL